MADAGIAERRLRNQLLTRAGLAQPADVVSWLGAIQAQEFEPAKWAIALRLRRGVDADIQRAVDEGQILRTHVMRPTWHFVTPADILWMLDLTAPCVRKRMATYWRQMNLDTATVVRGTSLIERAVGGGRHLTRRELGEELRRSGLSLGNIPLAHLSMYAELEGIVCSGPRRGKQSTYALVAERAPGAKRLSREEALATLAERFFRSHGPATIRDFVWWSGLATADATRGLAMTKARREEIDGRTYWTIGAPSRSASRDALVHLLPIYDEYVVAYRDRDAVPHLPPPRTSGARPFVTFQHAIVIAGQIAGTWRTTRGPRAVRVEFFPRRRLTGKEQRALADAASRYTKFIPYFARIIENDR